MKDTFRKIAFFDIKTAKQLKAESECIREYKGYSIAYGKVKRDSEGKTWWTVRIYKNEGSDRSGEFAVRGLVRTDAAAMSLAYRWAKENIDLIA